MGVRTRLVITAAVAALSIGASYPSQPPAPSAGVPPPGANDRGCDGPIVVLVHGTRADMTLNWLYISPRLREDGWCPWALDLPDRGQAPAAESAATLASFVRDVAKITGAQRVSIVGHSVGGIVGRHYVRFLGGRRVVDDLISMGTPQFGYHSPPPEDRIDALFNTGCDVCWDLEQGSDYLDALNSGDLTPTPVSYTQLITTDDVVAKPIANQYLPERHGVSNIVIQEACEDHHVDHLMMAGDDVVYRWLRHALSIRGPANPRRPVDCSPQPLPGRKRGPSRPCEVGRENAALPVRCTTSP